MKEVIYLSGPMSGYPNFNYDKFNEVTRILRDVGYEVINPVDLQGEPKNTTFDEEGNSIVDPIDWKHLLSRDIKVMLDRKVTMVVLLDGWEKSKGARAEIFICQEILGGKIKKFISEGVDFTLKEIRVDTKVREIK